MFTFFKTFGFTYTVSTLSIVKNVFVMSAYTRGITTTSWHQDYISCMSLTCGAGADKRSLIYDISKVMQTKTSDCKCLLDMNKLPILKLFLGFSGVKKKGTKVDSFCC
jgi:hypothetical protein